MIATNRPERARTARWRGAADVLALMSRQPSITRAEVARQLNLSSGSATEITARLRDLRLVSEAPAPARGRGRPTTVLRPHRQGPLVLALELRHEDCRWAVATLDGQVREIESRRHVSRDPGPVLAALGHAAERVIARFGDRVRALSLAVAGTVRNDQLVQASTLGWGPVDLGALTTRATDAGDLPLLVGNDATLAGVAEARTGAATDADTALHLVVEVGIGGALIVGGQPVTGGSGAGGEYGHVPFGDPNLRCPCGAHGCWDLVVDGRALARRLGTPPPADPRTYARHVLSRVVSDPEARRAVGAVTAALAGGIAGLVNAHDPEVVTLGGLAVFLRAAAPAEFEVAYTEGLMAFRRRDPPPVVDAAHGDDGALHGAVAVGLDHITSEASLAAWAQRHVRPA